MPLICYNERVKKIYARRFVIFSFSLGNFIHCLRSVGIRSYFTQRDVCRKSSSQYFSVEVKHNLHIALINNTPPNSFSVDFIHFKYRLQFGIHAQNRLMFGLLFFMSNFLLSINCPSTLQLGYQCQPYNLATAFSRRVTINQ